MRVNETLTLDFDNANNFDIHHYAFHVNDLEFDAISAASSRGPAVRERAFLARGYEDQSSWRWTKGILLRPERTHP